MIGNQVVEDLRRCCDALEEDNKRLREVLKTMVEMVEMNGFGRDYAIDIARAALAQEQGEKHDNQD